MNEADRWGKCTVTLCAFNIQLEMSELDTCSSIAYSAINARYILQMNLKT